MPPTSATISVSGLGSSHEATHKVTLIRGLSYTFTCDIFGADEEANVTWSLTLASDLTTPREEIDQAQSTDVDCVIEQDTETFDFVADVTEHNGMTLTCDATNSAGTVRDMVTLNVLGKLQCDHYYSSYTKRSDIMFF